MPKPSAIAASGRARLRHPYSVVRKTEHPGQSGINYIRSARVALVGRLAMVDLADINSELALLADSPAFGERVGAFFHEGVSPGESLRVTLQDGDLQWTTEVDGKHVVYTHDPETSWWQRFVVGLIGILPIHSQL